MPQEEQRGGRRTDLILNLGTEEWSTLRPLYPRQGAAVPNAKKGPK